MIIGNASGKKIMPFPQTRVPTLSERSSEIDRNEYPLRGDQPRREALFQESEKRG
jgi:hypothetical protein